MHGQLFQLVFIFVTISGVVGTETLGLHTDKPLLQSPCTIIPEEACFSAKAEYRVMENLEAVALGLLGPGRTCDHTTAIYTLLSGVGEFSVRGQELWSEKPLDRESSPTLSVGVSCQLEGSRYDRVLDLNILDQDDNLPLPPPAPLVFNWTRSMTNQSVIELTDLDTMGSNSFQVEVLDDVLDICRVHFTVRPTTVRGVEASILSIVLTFREGRSLTSSPYTVQLRIRDTNHPPPNTVTFPLEIRLPLPESRSLVQERRPTVQYPNTPVFLSRAASLHARVAEPLAAALLDNPAGPQFSLQHAVLNVTKKSGIIYVANTSALLRGPTAFGVRVEWIDASGARGFAQLNVEVVDTPPCLDHDHTDNLCSALTQRECLRTSCAYGLGALQSRNRSEDRCEWVGNSNSSSWGYATCTVDSHHCPDSWCDPLERLTGNLTCLQDCTQVVMGAGRVRWEVGHGVRPLTSQTFCSCDHSGACSCTGLPPPVNASFIQRKPQKALQMKNADTQTIFVHPNATLMSKSTQTPQQVNSTHLPLVPEAKNRRKEGCGFKCQTKAAIGITFIMSSCLFLLLFLTSRRQRRKTSRKVLESSNTLLQTLGAHRVTDTFLDPVSPTAHHEPFIVPDPRWEFPRESLVIEQCLGEGEFGRVLKARARDIDGVKGETVVAVKTLKLGARPVEVADLLAEYQMMKDVSHPNVVRLLGACTSSGGPVYIIIEYAEHGSLRTYLRRSRLVVSDASVAVPPLSYKTLLAFAWQISKGMSYLADNKLVHRDLAARNVLLATGNLCKISDFGLSRDVYEDEAYLKRSKGRVPVKWMALESLADHVYTTKSDVWSYGVVLWELVTLGSSPYPGLPVHNLFHLLKAGYRMPQPPTCTDSLYEVMSNCWREDPTERPPFWQITASLEALMEEGADYLPLHLEKRLVINRGYLAEFSPEDDFDFMKQDFGYKVPNPHKIEKEINQTSPIKRYENQEAADTHAGQYDSPRKLTNTSLEDDQHALNNLGLRHYTVLRRKTPNSYENDTQVNIDTNSDKTKNEKELKYDSKKCFLQKIGTGSGYEISRREGETHHPLTGYVIMNTRRASSVDSRPSSNREHKTVARPRSYEDNNAVNGITSFKMADRRPEEYKNKNAVNPACCQEESIDGKPININKTNFPQKQTSEQGLSCTQPSSSKQYNFTKESAVLKDCSSTSTVCDENDERPTNVNDCNIFVRPVSFEDNTSMENEENNVSESPSRHQPNNLYSRPDDSNREDNRVTVRTPNLNNSDRPISFEDNSIAI